MVRSTQVESLKETDNMATGGSQILICLSAAVPGFYLPLADSTTCDFEVFQKPKSHIQKPKQKKIHIKKI